MDKRQATTKAMALCSQREYTEADIRGKLKFWGAEPEDIDPIIEELIREKFIDDLRFAIAYVRDKVRLNQWGRIKIRYMLSLERVNYSIIDQALAEIDQDQYEEILLELLTRKSRELKNESNAYTRKQKLIKFALSRGFESEIAIRQIALIPGDRST